MEAGKILASTVGKSHNTDSNDNSAVRKLDLVDAMMDAADDSISDEDVATIEASACPTCGSCSGMFTANSMNCLTEALGLALPGNGSLLATHSLRRELFWKRDALLSRLRNVATSKMMIQYYHAQSRPKPLLRTQ